MAKKETQTPAKLDAKDATVVSAEKETEKTIKERQALTKAQKRRQTDKLNEKGELPRGYDWVDVISHLLRTGAPKA